MMLQDKQAPNDSDTRSISSFSAHVVGDAHFPRQAILVASSARFPSNLKQLSMAQGTRSSPRLSLSLSLQKVWARVMGATLEKTPHKSVSVIFSAGSAASAAAFGFAVFVAAWLVAVRPQPEHVAVGQPPSQPPSLPHWQLELRHPGQPHWQPHWPHWQPH